MDKIKYLEFAAIFMITLVFTIPFYIASANASLGQIRVKGSDGINSYARAEDSFDLEADVNLGENESITNDFVYLGSQYKFDSCAKNNQTTICSIRFPTTGTQGFGNNPLVFTINLYKGETKGEIDDSKSGTLIIDSLRPEATISMAENSLSGQDIITVNYQATDFACNAPSCSGKCVGLETIDIRTLDNSFTNSIKSNSSTCSDSGRFTIDASQLPEGANSLLIKAADKFGQVSEESSSATFSIDKTGPVIDGSSLQIEKNGILIGAYSSKPVDVELFVNIEGSDLDVNSVYADLTALNPDQNLRNVKGSCLSSGAGIFTCGWSAAIQAPSSATSSASTGSRALTSSVSTASRSSSSGTSTTDIPSRDPSSGISTSLRSSSSRGSSSNSIEIMASDITGNQVRANVNVPLRVDDRGPVINKINAGTLIGGQLFGNPTGNNVNVTFTEETGLSASDVILHVGSSYLPASSCRQDGGWICFWNNVNFGNVDEIVLSIGTDTTDVLLENVLEPMSVTVAIDRVAPVITDINVTSSGNYDDLIGGIIKVEDKLTIRVNVTEKYDIMGKALLSSIIPGLGEVEGSCQRTGSQTHVCTWVTSPIELGGRKTISFSFKDLVENSAAGSIQLDILGLDRAQAPDYWKNQISCSPRLIDRRLGQLLNLRSYCEIELIPNDNLTIRDNPLVPALTFQGISTLSISDATCGGDTELVTDVSTFNNEAGGNFPIIKVTFDRNDFRVNEINLTCTLDIFSRVNNRITKFAEQEQANLSFQFYNLSLGEVSEETQRKIDEAKEDAKGIWTFVGKLQKIVEISKRICQMINTFYNVAAAFYILKNGLSVTEATCRETGIANLVGVCEIIYGFKVQTCGTAEGLSQTADGLEGGLNKFCDFVNCRQASLWGVNVEAWLYSAPGIDYVSKPLEGGIFDPESGKYYASGRFMDPNNNLIAASLFGCVPGIISGLNKYRQIKCLYADCLETAVAQDGLPLTSCENQKNYATCKYVTGEIFAVIPYTALFDHFASIIKEALSNPFTALGIGVSAYCGSFCVEPDVTPSGGKYQFCRGARIFSLLGNAANNVKDIIDTGLEINQDYCKRLDSEEVGGSVEEPDSEEDSSNQASERDPL